MNNKGQITVFLSLLLASLLILFTAAVGITKYEMNKARVSEVSDGVCESIKADYNTYLFEKYHLLLLDKTYGGKGEAYLEEVAQEYMEYTMSDQGISVSEVALTTYASILDEDCQELKDQINEYMPDYLTAAAVETVIDKLTSDDSVEDITDALASDVSEAEAYDAAVAAEESSDSDTVSDDESSEDSEDDSSGSKDIRKTLKNIINGGLLTVVTPAGSSVSSEDIDTTDLPSASASSSSDDDDDDEVDTTFENLDVLESDLATMSSLTDAIESTNVYGVEYAMTFFNNFIDEKNSDAVLSCEVEYLIAGKTNDQDNLAAVVNRIVLHRLPVNMVVLMTDATKMAAVSELAAALSTATAGVAYVAIKYLLVACWAYGETLVEVRALLAGNSIQLVKSSDNWSLDLDGFANLATMGLPNYEGTGSINYETFLRLFLYEKQSKIYYRMCDLMQTNARQTVDGFRMSNCIYAFSLDITASDGSNEYNVKAVTGY